MRKALWIALPLIVVGVSAAGLVVYAAFFVNPASVLNEDLAGGDPEAFQRRLAALHQGEPPCLRYVSGPPAPEVTERVADRLLEAGFGRARIGGLVGIFLVWEEAHEAARHARDQLDEMVGTNRLPPLSRLVVHFQKERMREQFEAGLQRYRDEGKKAYEALSPDEQASLRKLWEQTPRAFHITGLVPLVKALQRKETVLRMEALAHRLRAERDARGGLPSSLKELEGLDDEALLDGWSNDIEYEVQGAGFRLVSRGRDGLEDGFGEDADIVRSYELPEGGGIVEVVQDGAGEGGGPAEVTAAVPCGRLPAKVTLRRRDAEKWIADEAALARSALFVPVLENGVAMGFKLSRIQEGSLFARVGLCDGDVVTELAGHRLDDPERAIEAYEAAKKAKVVPIRLRRAGVDGEITVEFR